MKAVALKQKDLFTRRWRSIVPQPKESAFHIQLVAMLRWCVRQDVIWRHVPNGEHRDPRTAAKLKAMGVLPGGADLEFHWAVADAFGNKRRHCLHLELKRRGNKPTAAQAGFALAMRLLGDDYHVACSVDEAIAVLGERGLLQRGVEVCGKRW
jgi:hypothetical protein